MNERKRITGEVILTGDSRSFQKETCPAATSSTTNPTRTGRDWKRTSAVRGWQLTVWVKVRPFTSSFYSPQRNLNPVFPCFPKTCYNSTFQETKLSVLVHSSRCQWACGARQTSATGSSHASSTVRRKKGSHASSSSVNPMYTIYSVSNFSLSALFPLIIFPIPHQYNCIWLMSFIISCMFYGNPLSLHPRLF